MTGTYGPYFEPIWQNPLFNDYHADLASVTALFASIAKSLTNQVRQSGTNSTPALGDVIMNQICVHIDWPCPIIPIIFVISSCMSLASVIFQTSKLGGDLTWKNNVVAADIQRLGPRPRKYTTASVAAGGYARRDPVSGGDDDIL